MNLVVEPAQRTYSEGKFDQISPPVAHGRAQATYYSEGKFDQISPPVAHGRAQATYFNQRDVFLNNNNNNTHGVATTDSFFRFKHLVFYNLISA